MENDIRSRLSVIEKQLARFSTLFEPVHDLHRPVQAIRDGYYEAALTNAGSLLEAVLREIWKREGITGKPEKKTIEQLFSVLKNQIKIDRIIEDYIREIQISRNRAAHGERVIFDDSIETLRKLIAVLEWFSDNYISSSPSDIDDSTINSVTENRLVTPGVDTHHYRDLSLQDLEQPGSSKEKHLKLSTGFILYFIFLAVTSIAIELHVFQNLENKLIDFRFYLKPTSSPVKNLVFVTMADNALNEQSGTELAYIIETIFQAGAFGIALDFLLPKEYGANAHFIASFLKYREQLALAAVSIDNGEILGTECLQGLATAALGADVVSGYFGFVNLDEDEDGIIRKGRISFKTTNGQKHFSFAGRALEIIKKHQELSFTRTGSFWIDWSVNWTEKQLYWNEIQKDKQYLQHCLKDTFVVLGGEYSGYEDVFRIPSIAFLPGRVPGMIVQGMIINTALLDFPIKDNPLWLTHVLFGLFLAVIIITILSMRNHISRGLIVISSLLLFSAITFVSFVVFQCILNYVVPFIFLVVATIVTFHARSRINRTTASIWQRNKK